MDRLTKKTFSRNLKTVREMLGQTQGEFAAKISMTSAAVSAWETGSSFPSEKTLNKIVEIHRIAKEFLLYGEGNIF
jgi:transcriptional regulator with XRE-family HTH domain